MHNFTLKLNSRLQPKHRHPIEDMIGDALEKLGCGEVTGGGTLLKKKGGEIEYCDIAISLTETSTDCINKLLEILDDIPVPKGSVLFSDDDGNDYRQEVGTLEGLALYLNGSDLPADVYENYDINIVIDELNNLLGDEGVMLSHWTGKTETALYYYGKSFSKMKELITTVIKEHPLCQRCRVEQIA